MQIQTAIKILNYNGKNDATLSVPFVRNGDKIRDLRAWLIFPDGQIREYDKNSFVRREATDSNTLFTEMWIHELSAVDAVRPGSVLACSYTRNTSSVFASHDWIVKMSRPVLNATLRITLPEGWSIRGTQVNKPDVVEISHGRIYTCVSVNQTALKSEDGSPIDGVIPFVGIDIIPSTQDRQRSGILVFDTWKDVACYSANQSDPHCTPDPKIAAKVEELTANYDNLWQKIQAVCCYVQAVNYVSIGKNLNEGGGYVPNSATKVLTRNYGDCKDKVALLRAMLTCLGVDSYAVSCQIDRNGMLVPERPTRNQFDHAIVALRVGEDINMPAIVTTPELGHLLIFDPTSKTAPVGHLDSGMQGRYFLIASKESSGLSTLPPQNSSTILTIKAELDATGSLRGHFSERSAGEVACLSRKANSSMSADTIKRCVGEWLSKQSLDTSLVYYTIGDDRDRNEFRIDVEFDSNNYAKRIGKDKLLYRAFMQHFPFYVPPNAQEGVRETPRVLDEYEYTCESIIRIPDGYAIESMPHDITHDESFGHIELRSSVEADIVRVTVKMHVKHTTIQAEEYERLRDFYKTRNKAHLASVMLRRQPQL